MPWVVNGAAPAASGEPWRQVESRDKGWEFAGCRNSLHFRNRRRLCRNCWMDALLPPFCSRSCSGLALGAGVIPQIESELLTDAINYLGESAINYRGHAQLDSGPAEQPTATTTSAFASPSAHANRTVSEVNRPESGSGGGELPPDEPNQDGPT